MEERPLQKMNLEELTHVWRDTVAAAFRAGLRREVFYASNLTLTTFMRDPKDKEAFRQSYVKAIENLMAVIDEHRPHNPEEDPEK